MWSHMNVTLRNEQAIITMDSNVECSLVLLKMPVSDLASFVIMMLVLVRECIYGVVEGELNWIEDNYVKQGVWEYIPKNNMLFGFELLKV